MSILTKNIESVIAAKASHEELVAAQKRREAECGVAPKGGGHLTVPAQFKSHANEAASWADYTNYGYPIFDKAHADDAASRWGDEHNRSRYSSDEQALISHRIEAAQARFGESDDNTKGSDSMSDEKTQGELEKEVTPDESKTAADPTTNETEATIKEADATTEKAVTTEDFAALLKTVISIGETVKTLAEAKPAEPVEKTAPVSDEETSRKELETARDTAIAEVAAKRAELESLATTVETLEQKAREKNAEYEAIVQRVLPTPDAIKDDVVVDPSKLAGLFTDADTPQVSDKTFVGMSDEAILNS